MKKITLLFSLCTTLIFNAQINEGFDDITTLTDYQIINVSDSPNTDIFQGNPAVFAAFDGATDSYLATNFNATAGSTIDLYIISPLITLENGDIITFYTRTGTGSTFPDRLEVRLDPTGTGTAPTALGNGSYSDLLLEINPTLATGGYPETWQQQTITISGLAGPVTTRFAFRYWVTNAGPLGANSNYIGIDRLYAGDAITCPDPVLSFDDFAQTTADISMDSSANYEIEWGEFPYTQGGGGSTDTANGVDTYQLTGLTPGVSYNVFVRKNCGGGDFSNYIEVLVGTSPNLNTFPYAEDLEPDANQALLLNLGLSFFTNTNNWSYGQDDTTDGDTTNDFANDGISYLFSNNTFTSDAADAWIYVGPFPLTANNQYDFSFFQRNFEVSSATRPAKDLEVVVATTNDGTTDNVLLTLNDTNNTSYLQRTASFTPTTSGDYYFGVHDITDVLVGVTQANSVIIDSFSISETLSVDEFDSNNFTYAYDNNLDILSMESPAPMTGIEIYSIVGQKVISQTPSSSQASINLSQLTDGVYIARVNINENVESFKFIKN